MKNFVSKYKIYLVLLLAGVILLTTIFALNKNSSNTVNALNEQEEVTYYYSIHDVYDKPNNPTLMQFLAEENSLERLISTNEDFHNSEVLNFVEIGHQPIELVGKTNFSPELVNGYEEGTDLSNQTISYNNQEILITPVNSYQLDERAFTMQHFVMYEGRAFDSFEYNYNNYDHSQNTIPIILGYNFSEYYSVGDTIPFLYFQTEWNGAVVGILEEGTTFEANGQQYNMDNVIVLPYLSEVSFEDEMLTKIYYSSKNWGYATTTNPEDFDAMSVEVSNISNDNNVKYEIYDLPY